MQTQSEPSTILFFSGSQTLKKIIEYSLEGCIAKLEHGTDLPKQNLPEQCVLVIFDGNLLNTSHAVEWEGFLVKTKCPVIILESATESKSAFLQKPSSRRILLRKPFDREKFVHSLQTLGLSLFKEGSKVELKKSEEHFDGAAGLPLQIQEQLSKEALAFVSDYCKSHFRSIAEEVLVKEIRRLTEERNSFLDGD